MKNFSMQMFSKINDISKAKCHGMSFVGIEYKYWLDYNKKSFLFKQDDKQILGLFELFCSYLGQKFGFDCVNCYPAFDGFKKGVIVENYAKNPTIRTISLKDFLEKYNIEDAVNERNKWNVQGWFSLEGFLKCEKSLNKDGIYFAPGLVKRFEKMILVDFLLMQIDRHDQNVEFLLYDDPKTGKKMLELAPMFDNGRMLGAGVFAGLYSPKELSDSNPPAMTIRFGERRFGEVDITEMAVELAKEIKDKPHLKKLYNQFKNLDILSEINYISSFGEYEISSNQKKTICGIFEHRFKMLEKFVEAKKIELKVQIKQAPKQEYYEVSDNNFVSER